MNDVFQFDLGACVGVDVGGTFTDAVLTEGRGVWRAKSPTTPENIGEGVFRAVELAAKSGNLAPVWIGAGSLRC